MARQSEGPWYRASKNGWYVKVEGKQISLKDKGEKNEKQAITAWHRLMVDGTPQNPKEAVPKPAEPIPEPKVEASVKDIVDAYLGDAQGRLKANTFQSNKWILEAFTEKMGGAKAEALTVVEVLAYSNRPKWSQAYKRNVLGSIKSAFAWASATGIIDINPIVKMKRPSMTSRGAKANITPDTHQRLLEAAKPSFRLFLTMLHETGARPSEFSRLTAQDVDFASGVAILAEHKTAHATGKPRLIFLTPNALAIVRTRAEAHPEGPLFRNSMGGAWLKKNIGYAMRGTCRRAGVKAIVYGLRHTYATDALSKGVPDSVVAALLGHSGVGMLHKHYSHVVARSQVLKEAASKVR